MSDQCACDACNGTGRVAWGVGKWQRCDVCKGKGRIDLREKS